MTYSRLGGNAASGRRDRLLVLTQYYRPEPNFITADVAEAMARQCEVTVITAHPNYPLGKFYPGTRYWWPQRTVENGVRVWRLPFVPDHSTSLFRRLVSYFSFLVMAACMAPWIVGRVSAVWVYQTPFTMGLAALWFKVVYRARIVFTCADLWPESFTASGVMQPGLVMRLLFGFSRWINRQADVIICATQSTLRRYHADGIPLDRLHWLSVWVDGIPEMGAHETGTHAVAPSIVYAGNLGPAQQLDTVIRAAALLHQAGVNVGVDMYGTGSSEGELRALADELGATNVRFLGRVAPEAAFTASSQSLAQVVSLRKTPLFRMTIPSKLYFCLASGAPVLAGLEGESAELAREAGAFKFDVETPHTLVDAIKSVLMLTPRERKMLRAQSRGYFDEHFAKRHLLHKYVKLIDDQLSLANPIGSTPSPSSFANT